jgi:hypothetical protein
MRHLRHHVADGLDVSIDMPEARLAELASVVPPRSTRLAAHLVYKMAEPGSGWRYVTDLLVHKVNKFVASPPPV